MVVGGGDNGSCCSYGGAREWFYFIFVFDGGNWQQLAVGVVVWVCKESGGFSE